MIRMRDVVRAATLAAVIGAVASGAARADDALGRALLGLGMQAITQGMQPQNSPRQGTRVIREAPRATRTPAAPQPSAPAISPQMRAAMDLQRDLNALGFDAGPVDGRPGQRTRAAVEAYQVSRGLPATGELTAMQRVGLRADAAAAGGSPRAERAARIRETQAYLAELGYDPGPADGAWGPRTQRALDAFRRDTGLPVGGGPVAQGDRAALYRQVHGVGPAAVAAVSPVATGAGQGPSFDCDRASAPAEYMICGSERLAALDRALSAAWARPGGGRSAAERQRQSAWIAERNACRADADCLARSMRIRIAELGGQVPAAAAPGALAAAGGGMATAPAPAAPGEGAAVTEGHRVHLARTGIIDGPDGFARRLALLEVRRDPSVLEDDDALDTFRRADDMARDPDGWRQADAAFRQMNPLEKADARAALRRRIIAEAQQVAEVTPGAPVPVAIYLRVTPGEFAEGRGLPLDGAGTAEMRIPNRQWGLGAATIRVALPGADRLPVDREGAKDLMNAARGGNGALTQVIWGRLTRIGVDEGVESFAHQQARAGAPTTFVPERAELHLLAMNDRAPMPVGPGAQPLHVWEVGGGTGGSAAGGQSALALARELGLPIADGRVAVGLDARADANGKWAEFAALAILGDDPAAAREGNRFAEIAAALLSDTDKRAFFGARSVASSPERVLRMAMEEDGWSSIAMNTFPDEFALNQARRTFFDAYYDRILARVPTWPLPVLHIVRVRLEAYNFEEGHFPLRYGAYGGGSQPATYRVVQLPGTRSVTGLMSAERFGNLPDRLEIPEAEAQVLRQSIQGNEIVLAWWSELDWSVDRSAAEALFGTQNEVRGPRPGRGTLTRIGLFAGPDLSWQLREFDPAAVMLPVPEPEAPQAEERDPGPAADVARLAAIGRADGAAILGAVGRLLGGGDAVYEALARTQNAVSSANEFDEPAAVRAAVAAFRDGGAGPLWLERNGELGTYDLEAGTFDFPANYGAGMQWQMRIDRATVTIRLVGESPFAPIAVPEPVARRIVESGDRRIGMLLALDPEAAETVPRREGYYELLARPREVIFYRENRETGEPEILARTDFGAANAAAEARMARRFEAADFEGLSDRRLILDAHVADLMALRGGWEPDGAALDQMAAAAWRHDRDAERIGPAFFDTEGERPDAAWLALHRDSFRSWITAKAAAAGTALRLRIVHRSPATCRDAGEPGGYYGNAPVMERVAGMREAMSDLGRRIRETDGPVAVPRRYAILSSRPRADRDQCGSWFGVAVIEDAMHEGHARGDAVASVVEFDLEGVERVAGQSAVPDMVIRGRATATRLEAPDGTLGAPLAPAPEPKPEAGVEVAARAGDEAGPARPGTGGERQPDLAVYGPGAMPRRRRRRRRRPGRRSPRSTGRRRRRATCWA